MKAAVLYEPHSKFVIEDLTLEPPKQGEVLVRLAACGVCHSDYHLVTGATKHPLPVVPGHEGAGVVEAVGPGVRRVKPGDHVVLNWAPYCGECFYCLNEKPNLCETFVGPLWAGTMLDGTTRLKRGNDPVYHFSGLAAFAEKTVVPEPTCVLIRKDVPLAVAALVGCAVPTGIGAVMNTARVRPGSSVAVFGCGGVGLNVVQGAALAGARTIIAVDRTPAKMDMVREFGATDALVADGREVEAVRELTQGRGADYVFEAVGAPDVQERAYEAVRPGGMLVLVGLSPMGTATNFPSATIARQEKTIVGSYYGTVNSARDFPLILDLYRAGKLKLNELVSREWRLEEINEAYEAMLGGDVARGVVVLDR